MKYSHCLTTCRSFTICTLPCLSSWSATTNSSNETQFGCWFPMVPSSRILTNKRTIQHVNVSDVTWGAGKMPWCQPAKMLLSYFPGHTSQIIYLRKLHTKSKSIYNLYIHLVKWSKMSSKSPSTNTRIRSQLHGKAKRTNGEGFNPHISTLNSVSKLISIHFPT